MQVPVLCRPACCHGAAVLDKQRQRVFRKSGYPVLRSENAPEQSALRQLWQKPWN